MKNGSLFVLILTLLFCYCKERPASTPPISIDSSSSKSVVSVPDTSYHTAYVDTDPKYDTSEVKRGNDFYKAYTEAVSLNDSSILEVVKWAENGPVHKTKNHNNRYSINFYKNGNQLFNRSFTKHDFLKLEQNGYLKESAPIPPTLRGVTADNRVVFDITFGIPDSDVGGIATLVTDMKGTPLLLQNYSHTGGGGCDSETQITSNGLYFLNCNALYGPNGSTFNFEKSDVVHASFLTDTTFVVIYNYITFRGEKIVNGIRELHEERDEISNNLVFYHVSGKRLASYRYDGFFEELGYTAPVAKAKGNFLVLDGEKEEVQVFSFANPEQPQTIQIKNLPQLKKRIRKGPHEEVYIRSLQKYYYFYFLPEGLTYYATKEYEE